MMPNLHRLFYRVALLYAASTTEANSGCAVRHAERIAQPCLLWRPPMVADQCRPLLIMNCLNVCHRNHGCR